MPAKIELQRTGFFREMPHGGPSDPSLAEARNAIPSPHEDRIAAYLDAGHVYIATPGTTPDVFDPGTQIGPSHYLTDGRFLWPGDLAHYVRTYHVRLDGAVLEHMLANGWVVPAEVDIAALAPPGRPAAKPDAKLDANTDPKAGSRPGVDLAAVLAGLVAAASSTGEVDTASLKKSLADAGDEVVRAAEALGDDLRRTLEAAGGKARAQLSASLRSLSDWLEKPDEERTAQAQAFVSSLEARMEEALAPQRRAEEVERRTRLSKEIRGSIAARLHEQGLDPGDDE